MKKVEKTIDCLVKMLKVCQKHARLQGEKVKTNDYDYRRNLRGKLTLGEEGILTEKGRRFIKKIHKNKRLSGKKVKISPKHPKLSAKTVRKLLDIIDAI